MPLSPVQWYPGHMARAVQALREHLQRVDVVVEVRDARIPASSTHPLLQQVAASGLVVLNRRDQIPPAVGQQWLAALQTPERPVLLTEARQGQGLEQLRRALAQVGERVNSRRQRRGMLPRAVRVAVVGCPNVGKSALINRLLGRRVTASAAKAGVTRQCQWVRLGGDLELLDTPGLLPPRLDDQQAAVHLAICDDISEAVYDHALVACALLVRLWELPSQARQPPDGLQRRYRLDPQAHTPESFLAALAERDFRGDLHRCAQKLLQDFRQGFLGQIALELPP
ncbi:MAG: ribosome biogenesis GTPase YlqF [Gloeomargarita sp. SKYBB_i_bin120]|nr:ribosome biogenesis GTPase YlqF [Gloeomargarita sp. SKYG98]MCS7292539.1 ribosome biogenesis GTPase YlqF [Gloeomargarita sp. SKYB120]MDW8178100.1 ribosome biogenesis GTPase YlqF [Gloeomargarita sp. SKYBB_i_bin120]